MMIWKRLCLPLTRSRGSIKRKKLMNGTSLLCTVVLMTLVNEAWLRSDKVSFKDDAVYKRDNGKWNAFGFMGKRSISASDMPFKKVKNVSCIDLFHNNSAEILRVNQLQDQNPKEIRPDTDYIFNVSHCNNFITKMGYVTHSLTEEEEEYPLAYSIVMYKHVEQVEMLLRAIYRPQNIYCIHVDVKARSEVMHAMTSIVGCFPNVFLASRRASVKWGSFTVLEADLICMEDVLKRNSKWKYFINLTGQEFPLKTNWELVRILKAVNGTNLISGTVKRKREVRTKWMFQGLKSLNRLAPAVPYNMTITKGPVHILATRDYVDFVINHPMALEFREWIKHSAVPDESFFTSLNHNPQLNIPGAYKGTPEFTETNPHIQRYKIWGNAQHCFGKHVRDICIFAIGDLPKFLHTDRLFANKFYLNYHTYTLQCLEELVTNRTREEVRGHRTIDDKYYAGLEYSWNHIPTSLNKI